MGDGKLELEECSAISIYTSELMVTFVNPLLY